MRHRLQVGGRPGLGAAGESWTTARRRPCRRPRSCPRPACRDPPASFPAATSISRRRSRSNEFSSRPASAANVWGFVDLNDNREYAVIGLSNGTAVVDVTDPANPREVATIGQQLALARGQDLPGVRRSGNRFRAYRLRHDRGARFRVQVIDLGGLPGTRDARDDAADTGSPAHGLRLQHRLRDQHGAAGSGGLPVPRGQQRRRADAWRVYSLANPAQPQFVRQAPAGTQYVHDATSLLITDPAHDAMRARPQSLRGLRRLQREHGGPLGRHRQGAAGDAVVDDLFGRELHAFRLADGRPASHLRARRDSRKSAAACSRRSTR